MARIRIRVGTRYVHRSEIYAVRQVLRDSSYLVDQIATGHTMVMAYNEILAAWSSGELRFEVTGHNAELDPEIPLKTHYHNASLDDLPFNVREETWRRYELILDIYHYYGMEVISFIPRRQIEAYLGEKGYLTKNTSQSKSARYEGTSIKSIERYLAVFVDSGGDIRSLIPQIGQRGGKGNMRLDGPRERILDAVLTKYAAITERDSTFDQVMTDVLNAVADENRMRAPDDQLELPSESTVRRRIKIQGEERILHRRLSRREQKARADVLPTTRPTRIFERVEIDHTDLDLFIVDEQDGLPIGRPYITACIDKYSSLVPGWHIGFRQGGYESIMLCLRHAILPKPNYQERYGTEHDYPICGLFEKLCIDNGRDFKSSALKNALAELGIIREEMPKDTPWFKGSIERYFRRVNQDFLKGKPGYTFGNTLSLGDYDAQKDAVISLSAFLEIFHVFMVDIYPHAWHKGIDAIPIQRWQESYQLFKPDLFEDADALRLILLPSAERTLQRPGIEWEHNYYRGPELSRLRELNGNKKVRFKYDPDDIDVVYVRDVTNPKGWLEFRSTTPAYTRGLSLAKHRIIRQYVNENKQTVDQLSLARAKARIQQIIEREFITTTKLRRRSKLKSLLKPESQSASEPTPRPARQKLRALSYSEEDLPVDVTGWSSDYDLPIIGDDRQ